MKPYRISLLLCVFLFLITTIISVILLPLRLGTEPNFSNAAAAGESVLKTSASGYLPLAGERRFWIIEKEQKPKIKAVVGVVLDAKTGEELIAVGQPDNVYPVASLTKLLTARVAKNKITGNGPFEIYSSDETIFGRQNLRLGTPYSKDDLFAALLVDSSNVAARALARLSREKLSDFVVDMKQEAYALGLTTSVWLEPTGLEAGNQASAQEIARLLYEDWKDPYLNRFLRAASYTLSTGDQIETTNLMRLDTAYYNRQVIAGKTGYIEDAGFSVAVVARSPQGKEIIVVVLGSIDHFERFQDAQRLIDWTWKHVRWREK